MQQGGKENVGGGGGLDEGSPEKKKMVKLM